MLLSGIVSHVYVFDLPRRSSVRPGQTYAAKRNAARQIRRASQLRVTPVWLAEVAALRNAASRPTKDAGAVTHGATYVTVAVFNALRSAVLYRAAPCGVAINTPARFGEAKRQRELDAYAFLFSRPAAQLDAVRRRVALVRSMCLRSRQIICNNNTNVYNPFNACYIASPAVEYSR